MTLRTIHRKTTWVCCILLAGTTGVGCRAPDRDSSASPAPFIAESAQVAIQSLAQQLEENFVYPDVGVAYARMLRDKLARGEYARFGSAAEFADTVTRDLQGVNREGHLRLRPPGETQAASPFADVPDAGKGVVRAGWITPGVGYMSIHGFQGDQEEYATLMNRMRTVLDTLSSATTLIIDARNYIGGALEDTDIMASYFFGQPATLLEFDTRRALEERGMGVLEESERLIRVDAPEGIVRRRQIAIPIGRDIALRDARIFVLTSKKTGSGGEGFALAMKRTGRATLIGATTGGAGHFGRTTELGGGYSAFIPVGRPFDPTTGKGWELVGVEPDVDVPAEQALDEALKRAGVDPAAGRNAVEALPKR